MTPHLHSLMEEHETMEFAQWMGFATTLVSERQDNYAVMKIVGNTLGILLYRPDRWSPPFPYGRRNDG